MRRMNEISELKHDLAFLKKFDSRNNIWEEVDIKNSKKSCERLSTNFLLHPKRLTSDSESSDGEIPTKAFAGLVKTRTTFKCEESCKINTDDYAKSVDVKNTNTTVLTGMKGATGCKSAHLKKKFCPNSGRWDNIDKKFTTLVEKTIKFLTNIRTTIEKGIPPADGEEDQQRRTKRMQEFSSRFSRVYLYPLYRQMDELSAADKWGAVAVNQKIMYAQQVILQGLQAYYNHLPSSIDKCCSDKLRSLLDQVLYLCKIYQLLKKDTNSETIEFIHAMRNHVELLLQAVESFDLKFVQRGEKPHDATKKKTKVQRRPNKLAMYAVSASFKQDADLKKTIAALAKRKLNVKSRYKTAGFKHRQPEEQCQTESKVKLFPKIATSANLKNSPRKHQIREDDIKTMVEMEAELEAPPNTGTLLNHDSSIAPSQQQLVPDNDLKMREEMEEGDVKQALEVLWKFFGDSHHEKNGLLEKIVSEVEKRKEEIEKPKKKPAKIVTVTGAKNAKLICIRDDNSVIEDFEEEKKDKEIMTDTEIILATSETQTDVVENRNIVKNNSIKISRLQKPNVKLLTLLPKGNAIDIIQYKLLYRNFHKHNPMYRKSSHIQPWILMGRISDEILNHLLQSITGELEMNEILENLYNAEFQY